MIKYILILFILLSLHLSSQEVDFNLKKFHKNFTEFDDDLHICHYETSNFWYHQFLKDSADLRPDSTAWNDIDYTGVMEALYHNHPNYYDHPVVNITRSEAKKFCAWLTIKYNSQNRKKYQKVVFRLPTKKEWVNAAYYKTEEQALFPFKKNPRQLTDKKGHVKAHYKAIHEACLKELNDELTNVCEEEGTVWINAQNLEGTVVIEGAQSDFTVQVNSYEQNKKLCNLAGNVFEIFDEGMIGGSYNSTGYFLTKHAIIDQYDLPHPEVGFRILMEVIKK